MPSTISSCGEFWSIFSKPGKRSRNCFSVFLMWLGICRLILRLVIVQVNRFHLIYFCKNPKPRRPKITIIRKFSISNENRNKIPNRFSNFRKLNLRYLVNTLKILSKLTSSTRKIFNKLSQNTRE